MILYDLCTFRVIPQLPEEDNIFVICIFSCHVFCDLILFAEIQSMVTFTLAFSSKENASFKTSLVHPFCSQITRPDHALGR